MSKYLRSPDDSGNPPLHPVPPVVPADAATGGKEAGPSDPVGARAFEWEGRKYAFGGEWVVFRRPSRRDHRNALRQPGVTHWIHVEAGGTTQLGTFALPGEGGRIFVAAEAVRNRFGGDFVGVFELGADSLGGGYWLVALSEEVILCDAVYRSLEEVRTAYRRLIAPGREFSAFRLPTGIAENSGARTGLSEFLDSSDAKLRSTAFRTRAATAVTVAGLLVGGFALGHHFWSESAPAANATELAQAPPANPRMIPLAESSAECERTVAEGLYAKVAGWSLVGADCTAGTASLRFRQLPGGERAPLQRRYGDDRVFIRDATATATVGLVGGDREVLDLWPAGVAVEELRRRLALLDTAHFLDRTVSTPASAGFETWQFGFATRAPRPAWLAAIEDIPGLELTSIGFESATLVWRIQAALHTRKE